MTKFPHIQPKRFLPLIFYIGYPLIVLTIYGFSVIPALRLYLKELIGFGIATTIVFLLILLINLQGLKKIVVFVATFLLTFLCFIKLSFYHHYGVKLSASALFVIFETHLEEASDFIRVYFDNSTIVLLLFLLVPYMLLSRIVCKRFFEITQMRLRGWIQIGMGVVAIVLLFTALQWKFQRENIILSSFNAYSEYKAYKKRIQNTLAKPVSEHIQIMTENSSPATNVIIIGESTSNWHMQLYGYQRPTNPLLMEIRHELMVFDSVIAPNVHTITALDKILTFSDYNEPNKKKNASIVQLANASGFETYWLSNQRPLGLHESMATTIGNASNHSFFINSEDYMDVIYDEKILSYLEAILSEPIPRKMIFIHLIGTHIDYKKRYPEAFKHFKEAEGIQSPYQNENSIHVINAYDNAVRYNDFIVRSVIELLRKQASAGYVAYFSDHGDEVYDTIDFMGHNEYQATRPMYEVPFIIWFSEDYRVKNPAFFKDATITQRPYNLEDFIFTFSDLNGMDYQGFDASRSILNPKFEKRTRWIKDQIDYDNR